MFHQVSRLSSVFLNSPSLCLFFFLSVFYFVNYVNFFAKSSPFSLHVIIAYYLMFHILQSLVYTVYYINSLDSQNNPIG